MNESQEIMLRDQGLHVSLLEIKIKQKQNVVRNSPNIETIIISSEEHIILYYSTNIFLKRPGIIIDDESY